jgi:hypothetical protein
MRVYKFLTAHFALKSLYERRLKISTFDDLNDPLELLPYNVQDSKTRAKAYKLRDDLTPQYGALCFSRLWSSPVMWAHYADKHKGICLGFEVPRPSLLRVRYVRERLAFPNPYTIQHLETVLFKTKYISWQYEAESRMVLRLERPEGGIYYQNFGAGLELAEVIGGHQCTEPLENIKSTLGDLVEQVDLIKARVAFGSFRVRPKDSGWK